MHRAVQQIRELDKYVLVTVLLLAVKAVNVVTSHKNIDLSKPALATCSLSFA